MGVGTAAQTSHQVGREPPIELRVSDIKQYGYCARIVYYQYVLPVDRVTTYKMEHGKVAQIDVEALEKRRKLRAYGIEGGERLFNLWLRSRRLGLSGRLDLLIRSATGYFPVDFKYTEDLPRRNHQLQLAAYALLVEEHFRATVNAGFLYLIPRKDVVVFELSEELKGEVAAIVREIREMVWKERLPEPTPVRARCHDCEYQNYCADIW
jgi:CRISPR-associated exonuclease Cas4